MPSNWLQLCDPLTSPLPCSILLRTFGSILDSWIFGNGSANNGHHFLPRRPCRFHLAAPGLKALLLLLVQLRKGNPCRASSYRAAHLLTTILREMLSSQVPSKHCSKLILNGDIKQLPKKSGNCACHTAVHLLSHETLQAQSHFWCSRQGSQL